MKITFYLMTKKGFEVLNMIIKNDLQHFISEVVFGKDNNVDNDFSNEISSLCKQNNLNYFERKEEYKINSDYSFAVSWRWLIPETNSKLIVLHDSILPKYRGFSPLVNMLINEEPEIGVSALFATSEYDKGDIIAQSSTKIDYPITISEAIEVVSKNYCELVIKIINTLKEKGKVVAFPQKEEFATYSLWRNEEDYLINWQNSSDEILRFINAVSSPYKGASAFINGTQKIRILEAETESDVRIENRSVGKIIFVKDEYPIIVCGSGLLKLLKVVDDQTQESLLPFQNFRLRLTGVNNP